jgi:peptidoglycan/LPS O-acetylase OafA/YrhL
VRGVAALAVFVGHLALVVLPDLVGVSGTYGWSIWLSAIGKSPLAVLWNGNAAVCIFFVLSGYVMSEFATGTKLSLPAQAIRRYLRLAIPILITSSFAWLLLRSGLMRNAVDPNVTGGWLGIWYSFEPSVSDMIQEALFGTFATGSNAYNCNLWTMNTELAGSLYIMLFCAIARSRLERTMLYALLAAMRWADYLPLFAVGALLRDYEPELRRMPAWAGIALFAVGAYICSLPSVPRDTSLPWHVLLPDIFSNDGYRYWHSIGAALIVLGVLRSASLQVMFASHVGRFLGRISFTLYLIHIPLLCSFTAAVVLAMKDAGRLATFLVAGPATVALVLGASWLLSDPVDGFGVRFSRAAGRLWMRAFSGQASPLPSAPAAGAAGLVEG